MQPKIRNLKKVYFLLIGIIIMLAAIFVLIPPPGASVEPVAVEESVEKEPEYTVPETVPEKPSSTAVSIDSDRPILYIVLDDAGNNLEQLKPFLKFPGKLTFAIMPQRTYTRDSYVMIRDAGFDAILHQPMEAMNSLENPGAGALYTGMSYLELESTLDLNLRDLPGIRGMNNHMGSLATSDEGTMLNLFRYLGENKLFFLDSYTTADSVAEAVAKNTDVSFIKRSVFIDNDKDKESMLAAINKGLNTAEKNGHAVLIGHVTSSDLAELLIELYPGFIEDGFSLKDLSSFLLEDAGA